MRAPALSIASSTNSIHFHGLFDERNYRFPPERSAKPNLVQDMESFKFTSMTAYHSAAGHGIIIPECNCGRSSLAPQRVPLGERPSKGFISFRINSLLMVVAIADYAAPYHKRPLRAAFGSRRDRPWLVGGSRRCSGFRHLGSGGACFVWLNTEYVGLYYSQESSSLVGRCLVT